MIFATWNNIKRTLTITGANPQIKAYACSIHSLRGVVCHYGFRTKKGWSKVGNTVMAELIRK